MLISILAVYNHDNTIFDDFSIPADMNKPVLIKLLLQKLAELSLVYSAPDVLKEMIGVWSQTRKPIWEHLYNLAVTDYNPIENYNKSETKGTGRSGGRNGNNKKQNYNYGFNEAEKRAHHDDTEEEYSDTFNEAGQENTHTQGNIGVTTTQQMIEQELNIRPKLDIYNFIIEEFKSEFCIMIY